MGGQVYIGIFLHGFQYANSPGLLVVSFAAVVLARHAARFMTRPMAAVEETRIIGESPQYGTNLPVSFAPVVMHCLHAHVSCFTLC